MSKHRKMQIQSNQLLDIKPVGDTQQKVFEAWGKDKNLFLTGSAGTGKTFILLHMALKAVLDKSEPYEKVVLVRSLLPSRDIGFLPGTLDEKSNLYQDPYRILIKYLFEAPSEQDMAQLYDKLLAQG